MQNKKDENQASHHEATLHERESAHGTAEAQVHKAH